MSILLVDLGTYCDNSLMYYSIQTLQKHYKIVCLTDEKNSTLPSGVIKEPYHTPGFFLRDSKVKAADPQSNIYFWVMRHPRKALKILMWIKTVRTRILEVINKYQPKGIIMMYPVLPMVWQLPRELFDATPIFIVYYAPGLPNNRLPWLFDSSLRDPNFKLYKTDESNWKSGYQYIRRLAMYSKIPADDILDISKKIHHVLAWDDKVVPQLRPTIKEWKVHKIGALYDMKPPKMKIPKEISTFIKGKRVLFMSFGSYVHVPALQNILPNMYKVIEEYCEANNTVTIFHNGVYNSNYIMSYKGFISYHAFIPKVDLVIFTGSLCLQSICLMNSTPMLFVPLLTEQFYWAKNHKYHTGVPYVDFKFYQDVDLKKCMTSYRLKQYLSRVSASMRSYNASADLDSYVRSVIH